MATTPSKPEDQPPEYTDIHDAVSPGLRPFWEPEWSEGTVYLVNIKFKTRSWKAELIIKTRDLARLMRESFSVTADNIHRDFDVLRSTRAYCQKYDRIVFLSFLAAGDDGEPAWVGLLQIIASPTSIVVDFDPVADLRTERTRPVEASQHYNVWKAREIYYVYFKGRPSKCFNLIYGDMQLPGLWPWPREKDTKSHKVPGLGRIMTIDRRKAGCVLT